MNKNTLNIISVCVVSLIIVFAVTKKNNIGGISSDNIIVSADGKIQTKADQYQANILETIVDENVKNFKKFTSSFEKNSSDNLTDGLSKDIFTQYVKYNTSGVISQEDIAKTTQEILKNKTGVENPVIYSEIQTVTSNITNLKIYGNNIAIIQNGVNKGINSLSNKSNKTPYIASIYMKTSEILTETNVPESLSESHINLINGLKKYSEGLIMMDQQLTDPAKALLGLNKVKDATTEVLTSFEKIKKTIILNKIDYTENDPGFIWISNNANNTSIRLE
jgi:hypothetical protein